MKDLGQAIERVNALRQLLLAATSELGAICGSDLQPLVAFEEAELRQTKYPPHVEPLSDIENERRHV